MYLHRSKSTGETFQYRRDSRTLEMVLCTDTDIAEESACGRSEAQHREEKDEGASSEVLEKRKSDLSQRCRGTGREATGTRCYKGNSNFT